MKIEQSPAGEKSSDQNSHHDQRFALESQIRECYGRVVYSHKIHEKCVDLLMDRSNCIKGWQLFLSAVTTGSFLGVIFGEGRIFTIIGAVISTGLLVLNSYVKDVDLVSIAEKHNLAANKLWNIREDYLSLLTDFSLLSIEKITIKRDELQSLLSSVYSDSPRTNSKAYKKAQEALKNNEELTFSDQEIDYLLPQSLRRNK
ncbi:SLATT domain-containing protein [Paenibacillus sp. FSL H8-0280]|uniref:SLATT domain-containing protein n=1 Tax=Paenibacillus sp. FSL H8-0280 TaxID=2921382 RepID=UPI00324A75D3